MMVVAVYGAQFAAPSRSWEWTLVGEEGMCLERTERSRDVKYFSQIINITLGRGDDKTPLGPSAP